MELYNRKRWWKFLLVVGALAIGGTSLFFTNKLSQELRLEETRKMELWAKANRQFTMPDVNDQSLALVFDIIQNNTTVPLIIADSNDTIYFHRNISLPERNDKAALEKELVRMKNDKEPIPIDLGNGEMQYIYYSDSILLRKLRLFPVVQLLVVILFVALAYWAFSAARRWEQDQVWVGMAKETAHQLGTPTSSLLGWVELLSLKQIEPSLVQEMQHDITRLQTITARFSKIGARPELETIDLRTLLSHTVQYLSRRISSSIHIELPPKETPTPMVKVNRPLFEWVIENLTKNAADALEGQGTISIHWGTLRRKVFIDVADTGKGIARQYHKTVFKPGYTTKKRGWGLGLTLARRIVEDYHKGQIMVRESTPGKGTTFRITLPG
jgi:signal transduction histidine kinase